MGKITSRDLYSLVDDHISKRITYNTLDQYQRQSSRTSVQPYAITQPGSASEVTSAALIDAIQVILDAALPSQILSGLNVTATDPISNKVTVSSGSGTAGGRVYELSEDVNVPLPFDATTEVFHLYLYFDRITFEKSLKTDRVHLADVIIPDPGNTSLIQDKRDGGLNAYIMMRKPQYLYGDANGNFEEDTIELLRDNIREVLADNIIGNLRLSENLKILNTQGTLEIDSGSLKIYDKNETKLSEFNKNGIFFYDNAGRELSRFTNEDARIGNIVVEKNRLRSGNFVSGDTGFEIKDDGNVEFNNLTVRGTVFATAGEIGGWTIGSNKIYGTTTGVLQTGENVGAGQNGVKLSIDGLEVFDDVLGRVVYLPSDGSAPQFSSGVIQNTTFEINTNSVLRTSETVGDGTSNSYGVLINNTGLYGVGANQTLATANLKALVDGTISITGEITSESGQIGGVTITPTKLSGGLIEGSTIRSALFETSATVPKITIDTGGISYQLTSSVGTYGAAGSGLSGFLYGDGTLYGSGIYATLFNELYPAFAILAENEMADLRLYNRSNDPTTGTHQIGDIICVSGVLKICITAGSPGTFQIVGLQS